MAERPDHLVVGLGTGRCGTKSLAGVLGVSHEAHPLPWIHDERLFRTALRGIEHSGGDVGCYWLNYVERVLEANPESKFVCIKRPREETVQSWKRRFKGSERFGLYVMHTDQDGRIRAPLLFPDYGDMPIEEAARCYWDEYYQKAEKLEQQFPKSFRVFWMNRILNDKMEQRKMLRFANLPWKSWTDEHANRGAQKDAEFGNILRETIGWLIENEKVYLGTKAIVTPKEGSRLGRLAVSRGISRQETDEILMDFRSLADRMTRVFDFDMIYKDREGAA